MPQRLLVVMGLGLLFTLAPLRSWSCPERDRWDICVAEQAATSGAQEVVCGATPPTCEDEDASTSGLPTTACKADQAEVADASSPTGCKRDPEVERQCQDQFGRLQNAVFACRGSISETGKTCNTHLAKLENIDKRFKASEEQLKAAGTDAANIVQFTCQLVTHGKEFLTELEQLDKACTPAMNSSRRVCDLIHPELDDYIESCGRLVRDRNPSDGGNHKAYAEMLNKTTNEENDKLNNLKTNLNAVKAQKTSIQAAVLRAEQTVAVSSSSGGAGKCEGKKDDDTGGVVAGGPNPAGPGETLPKGEDTAKKEDEKKQQPQQGGADMAGLANAAMGMLGQLMQPQPEGEKAKPAELAADDCRRAENAQSQICICRVNPRLPGCMLNQGNNDQPAAAFNGGGTGGAPLTQDTTGAVNIPSMGGPQFPGLPENANVGAGGPAGVMAAGGSGGLGGGMPSLRGGADSGARGPSGTSLSAGIYEGSRGGAAGGAIGSRFGNNTSRGRDSDSSGGRGRDPSQMPGYTLGSVVQNPAFARFKKPEGISGLVGKGKQNGFILHGSHRNIFQVMTERYHNLENPIDLP